MAYPAGALARWRPCRPRRAPVHRRLRHRLLVARFLKHLSVDALKIDQSFVRDIDTDPDDRAIVQAIIQMARALNLKTIAEGVETDAQHQFLRREGCDMMQGYRFCRPMDASALEMWMLSATRAVSPTPANLLAPLIAA